MAINKRKILQSAQKHLQKGALEKALKDYQTLLGADPRDTNVRLKIGDLQLRRGDTGEAVDAYLRVAHQFMKDGFDAKAVAIYKQVHKIDAERQEIWEPLAELYQRMGLSAEAMLALQTAADMHHQGGRRREALDLLRKMASLDPTNTTSRIKVAELLRTDGRSSEAAAEYREAAAELERQGEAEGAASALEQAIELQPEDAELYAQAVHLHVREGNAARAEPLARRLIEIDPESPSSYEQLAAVLQASGREEALAEVYRRLAEVYRKRGDEDQARAILQRFVPVEPLGREDSQGFEAPLSGEGLAAGGTPDFGDVHALEVDPGTLAGDDAPVFGDLPPIGEGPAGTGEQLTTPSPEPSQRVPVAEDEEVEADPDQLLAEASVYLRYGKHDRAIASLQSLLAVQPRHGAALEKLGEAWTVAEQLEQAVTAFVQAAELARQGGDAERFDVLRGRVAAIDPEAAADLAVPTLPSEPEPEPESEFESESDTEYLDDDVEFSISDDVDGLEADATPEAASLPEPVVSPGDEEGDEDVRPVDSAVDQDGEGSSTTPEQIVEDLEEADFYRQQGMVEEAARIYRRVLELAPGHPQAMLRLGEIEAAREPSSAEPVEESSAAGDGVEIARDAFALEPESEAVPSATGAAPAAGLLRELAEDSFGLSDETPDPFGFAEEPPPPPEPRHEAPPEPLAAEPRSGRAEATLPGVGAEPEAAVSEARGAPPDDGFDLAAALSDALAGESGGAEASTEDEGFAALFHDFKRGVQETLGSGDVESRYDLGIAYREMGLLEDAFEEFRIALGSPQRRYDALHMLAESALELGRAADVVPRLREALDEGAPEAQQPALRFDLGSLHEALGETSEAAESFRFVAGIAPGFREVEQRIEALVGSGPSPAHTPEGEPGAAPPAAPREVVGPTEEPGFESFADVVSQFEQDDASERPGAAGGEPPAEPAAPQETPGPQVASEPEEPGSLGTPVPTEDEEPARPRTRRRKISFF